MAGVVLLGALAFAGYRIYLNEATDEAIELVPQDALFYGNVFLNPSTRQKQALRDLLERFPAAGTPDAAENALAEILDRGLSEFGLTFERDVQPLLGRQIALAVLPPEDADDNGVLDDDETGVLGYLGTTDPDAAMDLFVEAAGRVETELEERSYKGHDFRALPDGTVVGPLESFLVIGDRPADFQAAVDASEGASLADSPRFEETTAVLPRDKLALAYFGFPAAIDALIESGELPADAKEAIPYLADFAPVAAAAYLRPDAIVVQAAARTDGSDSEADPGAIADLPRDAWAAVGVHDLGKGVERLLPQVRRLTGALGGVGVLLGVQTYTGLELEREILSWMGDAAWFLRGRDQAQLQGGFVVESGDAAASIAAVHTMGTTLRDMGLPVGVGQLAEDRSTFSVADPSVPEIVQTVAERDRVWVAYGDETARRMGGPRLADGATFRAASSALEDYAMTGYLDVQALIKVVERTYALDAGSLPSPYVTEVKPNLDPLSYLVLGTRTQSGVTSVRLMIGVK